MIFYKLRNSQQLAYKKGNEYYIIARGRPFKSFGIDADLFEEITKEEFNTLLDVHKKALKHKIIVLEEELNKLIDLELMN